MPEPQHGDVLVNVAYLSPDLYQRGRMRDAASYAAPVGLGEVMTGGIVGEVVKSNNPRLAVGDIVEDRLGWQEYAIGGGPRMRKVDPSLAPISTANGVLGMPGMTAYFGLLDCGQPKPGETIVVSAASGAVGQIVGQIGKLMGCRVIGIAGGARKCDFVERYPTAMRQMGEWIKAGRIKYREDIVEGIDKAPRAFIGMLRGENFGKMLVKM